MTRPSSWLRRALTLLLSLVVSLGVVLAAWQPSTAATVTLRKVAGDAPAVTISHFLAITGAAESQIRDALAQGLREPGLVYSNKVHQQADAAVAELQQATEAMDLSQVPVALRPMTGVSTMLMLRSLLAYDLSQQPQLQIPDRTAVLRDKIQTWTVPGTPISLQAIGPGRARLRAACGRCSSGDFLFSSDTLDQVPQDFERIFGKAPHERHRFGADLYTYWSLLPGGAIPPKLFFVLPANLRRTLIEPYGGQSLLQWLLLLPVTSLALALLGWWIWQLRGWQLLQGGYHGPWPHAAKVLALLPPLLLLWFWEWFAINWVNLYGPRQAAVLVISSLLSGVLIALFVYLLAEAVGQLISHRRFELRPWRKPAGHERRKGAGQILTVFRIVGLLGATAVAIQTGRNLGMTSLTLLAVSSVPALAISLGTQQLIRDIADGFSLLLDGQIKPGDRCTIGTKESWGQIKGTIRSLGMRSIRLLLEDGSELSVPNSMVATATVTNHRFSTCVPLEVVVPLSGGDAATVEQHLVAVRAVLATFSCLERARVDLEVADQGWQLCIRGAWSTELSPAALAENREQLLLRLFAITPPHPAQ